MRLKQHINESGYETKTRSKPIDLDKGIELIKKECKNALSAYKKGKMFYRGIDTNSQISYIEPSKHVRVSANTVNLYTLVIDNSKKWDPYPKRSQSVICSTDRYSANGYGETHIVFPKDGYKIGICPSVDMWYSFDNLGNKNLMAFNVDFMDFIKSNGLPIRNNDLKTIRSLKSICSFIDTMPLKEGVELKHPWMRGYKGDLFALLESLFDPRSNGFKVVNNIEGLPSGVYEVWTDSDCYLVKEEILSSGIFDEKKSKEEIEKSYTEFLLNSDLHGW